MPPKKPKLTPEEKKALKAKKKAEKKRKQIERKKQLKRDQLDRELKYGELTLKRHEKEWRQMLIKIALPKMREDLEFAWHNFERVIDCKNFTISLLMDEIRDAEEQYMMNVRNHVEHIDKLIDMFHERLEELDADNKRQLMDLQRRAEEDVEEIRLTAGEEENYIKTMLYMLEVARKEQKQTLRAEYFSKLEEEETKNTQIVHRLRGVLESKIQFVYKDALNFLDNYNNQVKERKRDHNALKVQDDILQKLLCNQLERIRKAYDYIKWQKTKLSDSQKLLGRKLKELEIEYDFFKLAFSSLKKRLLLDRENDFNKLRILTVFYNETIQELEKLKEKGEHILHVAAVCRKLETQEEKIMAFPVCIIHDLPGQSIEDIKGFVEELHLFWQRVGQVDASRYAINEEREFLKAENDILKMKLHQYCQCIGCPTFDKEVKNDKITHVTEGTLEKKKYDKHNFKQFFSNVHFKHYDIDE